MLIREVDACRGDDEWQALLAEQTVGQLIVPRRDDLPDVVPTHFVYDGARCVELHLAAGNPVWDAVGTGCRALFTVTGPFVYVPTAWNASPGTDPAYGIPTSYYAAVVATVDARPVDEPEAKAALLRRQLGRFQPEGGHAPVEPGAQPYGRALRGIRGLVLDIVSVQAKFKFGGNKALDQRREIAERLAERAEPGDAAARAHLLRRSVNE